MSRKWEWDERNPYENAFEESLLSIPGHVVDTVFRKLFEVKLDPKQGEPACVAGRPIYTIRTEGNGDIPPLLIVYSIDEKTSLIRTLWVSRAGSVEEIADELRTMIENAPAEVPPPLRRVLDPVGETTIPREKIREAVEYVIAQRKARGG
jgi:hypothetical protein